MANGRLKKEIAADSSLVYNSAHDGIPSSRDLLFGGPAELEDLAFSAQQALNRVPVDAMHIDPTLQTYHQHNDTAAMDVSRTSHSDSVIFSIEDLSNPPMDEVQVSSNAYSAPPVMEPISPGTAPNGFHVRSNGGAERPLSPRANPTSLHQSPLTPNKQYLGWPGASSGARKFGKAQTPHRSNRKSNTPRTPSGRRCDSKESLRMEPRSETKARASSSAIVDSEEDMASLALALQLQMEEHGLRRRSMV